MGDHTNHSQNQAKQFSSKPIVIGRTLLVLAVFVLAWSFFLAQDQMARDISKIAGAAFGLLGIFAYGFGKLAFAANKSPREE